MIKWTGKSTNKVWAKTIEAESFRELLETLIDEEVIDGYWLPESLTFHELGFFNEMISDLEDKYEEDPDEASEDIEKIDWDEVLGNLTDDEFQQWISSLKSQAYYQEFEITE